MNATSPIADEINRLSDIYDHCIDCWYNWPSKARTLAEAYMDGDCQLALGVSSTDASGLSQICEGYAFIQRLEGMTVQHQGSVDDQIADKHRDLVRDDGNEFDMLINVRHLKDGAESFIPSAIRFCFLDRVNKMWSDPPQLLSDLSFKLRQTWPSREVDSLLVGNLGEARHRDGSVIEGGTQVIDNLAGSEIDRVRDRTLKLQLRNFVSRHRIWLDDDNGNICVDMVVDDRFEVRHLLCGPTDLGECSAKLAAHETSGRQVDVRLPAGQQSIN